MMKYRRQLTGSIIHCDQLLGKGGEGSVYATSVPGMVAKVYHQGKRPKPKTVSKLNYMINNPPTQPGAGGGHTSIIWPVDLLEEHGVVAGYLMPRLSEGKPLASGHIPSARKKDFPGFTWRHSLAIAYNLAWVFSNIHAKGYVIGDVNDQNLQVTNQAMVSIIDTDSFQIHDLAKGEIYNCPVLSPEYAAPELTQEMMQTGKRTMHQDNFSLAVLIFRLLFGGRHPFSGTPAGNKDILETPTAIRQGATFFNPKANIVPARSTPPSGMLPDSMLLLFQQAFVEGHQRPELRPSAEEWKRALKIAENADNFATCPVTPMHVYMKGKNCPWCVLRDKYSMEYYDPRYKPPAAQPQTPKVYNSASQSQGPPLHRPSPPPQNRPGPQKAPLQSGGGSSLGGAGQIIPKTPLTAINNPSGNRPGGGFGSKGLGAFADIQGPLRIVVAAAMLALFIFLGATFQP